MLSDAKTIGLFCGKRFIVTLYRFTLHFSCCFTALTDFTLHIPCCFPELPYSLFTPILNYFTFTLHFYFSTFLPLNSLFTYLHFSLLLLKAALKFHKPP